MIGRRRRNRDGRQKRTTELGAEDRRRTGPGEEDGRRTATGAEDRRRRHEGGGSLGTRPRLGAQAPAANATASDQRQGQLTRKGEVKKMLGVIRGGSRL